MRGSAGSFDKRRVAGSQEDRTFYSFLQSACAKECERRRMFQPGPQPEPSTVFRRALTREEELPSVHVPSG